MTIQPLELTRATLNKHHKMLIADPPQSRIGRKRLRFPRPARSMMRCIQITSDEDHSTGRTNSQVRQLLVLQRRRRLWCITSFRQSLPARYRAAAINP